MKNLVVFAESVIVGFGVAGILLLGVVSFFLLQGRDPQGVVALQQYDAVAPVACGSYSMGLAFGCGDQLLLREIPFGQNLTLGSIYTYDGLTGSVVHRYLGCANENCSLLVFHGDANMIAEHVRRENVTYEVVGVYY